MIRKRRGRRKGAPRRAPQAEAGRCPERSERAIATKTAKGANGATSASSLLGRYFAEISRYPVLDRDEEVRLAREARAGCERAHARLVECNLRFVVKIAREYRNLGLPLEDLVNEGNLGLIEAARRFDPERGTKFIGWAVWWIRKRIRAALSDQSQVVRLPVSQTKKIRQVQQAVRSLKEDLGREPTGEEIASQLPANLADLDPIHRHGIRFSGLDEPLGDDPQQTLARSLEDTSQPSVELQLLDREATDRVHALYEKLNDQQRTVLSCRFGLDGGPPQTLAEIGRRIGLSREGVRLIEGKAVERLRRLYRAPRYSTRPDVDNAA